VNKRLLVPSSALLWGLQLAFLSPALALILTNLYRAATAEVGWVLAVYNTSGLVASLLLPAYADRRQAYLQVRLRPVMATRLRRLRKRRGGSQPYAGGTARDEDDPVP
jgi:MFS family permease